MDENFITLEIIIKLQSLMSEQYFWFFKKEFFFFINYNIFLNKVECGVFHNPSFMCFWKKTQLFEHIWKQYECVQYTRSTYLHHNSSLYSCIDTYMCILLGETHMFQTHKVYSNNSPQLKLYKLITNTVRWVGCIC